MFQIDLKSRKSIYQQVVDNMKELMITGVLKANEKIPSVRDLSKMILVNPNTVQKAYRELEYQGYIYTTQGKGTFVAERNHKDVDMDRVNEVKGHLRTNIKELQYLGLEKKDAKEIIDDLLAERSEWK